MEALISVRDLAKVYTLGDVEVLALRSVSLDIGKGEFVAIMGASGSGKSTFMNVLGCLDRPTHGSYLLAGADVSKLDNDERAAIRNRELGFVFQNFNLIPVLSASENIELPILIAGRDPDEEWVKRVVDIVGLGDRLSHRPSELSGGQQQRVAVARALASKPAVVFADEPTGNLDSRSGQDVLQLLRRAVDEFGQTVVMVTHDPGAASVADRLLLLEDGRIVHDGEAGETADVIDLMKGTGA